MARSIVKMLFHGGPEADPDNRDLALFEPYVKKVAEYVRDHLPGVDHAKPAIQETCIDLQKLPILHLKLDEVIPKSDPVWKGH